MPATPEDPVAPAAPSQSRASNAAEGETDAIEAAVLIVCHNGLLDLPECLESVFASQDENVIRHIVVVDNASSDGSAAWIAAHYPQVSCVRSECNLGFAGGNNLGWAWISRELPRVQYVALLNQDTVVASGWLAYLVTTLDRWPTIGVVQAKILLHPERDRINTAGNVSHFLGFGFTRGYQEIDQGQYDRAFVSPPLPPFPLSLTSTSSVESYPGRGLG